MNLADLKTLSSRVLALVLLTGALSVEATERVYQLPEEFIAEVFMAKPPPKLLWLTKNAQLEVTDILGHAPRQLRQRYWAADGRTLWILEEIGKEELITAGFVIKEGRIESAKVLIYREGRGMEVRYPAFLKQFKGAMLSDRNHLDQKIDSISGATLSVYAMQRMARAALYFDRLSRTK